MLCYGPVFEILIYTRSLIHSTSVRKQNQGASSLSSLYWESLKSHGTKSLPHLREASSRRKSSSDASAFLRRPPWVTLPLFFTSKLEQDRWCHSFRCSTFWSRGTDCFLRRTAAERREGRKTHNYSFEDTQLHSVRFPPPKDTLLFLNVCSRHSAKTPSVDGDITHVYRMRWKFPRRVCEISGPLVLV